MLNFKGHGGFLLPSMRSIFDVLLCRQRFAFWVEEGGIESQEAPTISKISS